MEKFDLAKMQKKGSSSVNKIIVGLIGALVVILILVQLAPTFFTGLGSTGTGLGNVTANPSVPTWLPTIMIIIIATGLVFMAWRVFSGEMK